VVEAVNLGRFYIPGREGDRRKGTGRRSEHISIGDGAGSMQDFDRQEHIVLIGDMVRSLEDYPDGSVVLPRMIVAPVVLGEECNLRDILAPFVARWHPRRN
jgi:hypothetical protein